MELFHYDPLWFSARAWRLFLGDSAIVRQWLPDGLHPNEAHPGHAVIALTAFDFNESEVGPYGELVLSALVRPYAHAGDALPHAATFPIALATTTEASRQHATERWCLPQFEHCIEVKFSEEAEQRTVEVHDRGVHVLTLQVSHQHASNQKRLYQAFSVGDAGVHRVNLDILGEFSEHQDQTGELELSDHPLTEDFAAALLQEEPYLEQSMGIGEQQFGDLILHGNRA